ncbi:MAG: polyprenyl synthetase family protein [Lachnospiraceae bacterium]|nr:polyprenyl synthetase family protein [Lachnospiraceae bacterium]
MSFTRTVNEKALEVENILKEFLPAEEGFQKTVTQAMNYSFLAGGKRLRPMILQETFRSVCVKRGTDPREDALARPFMAAIEMIHTYSLIHDDLPAMDNDDYRRGRKTNHVVYGEAMAILAGDGLLNYAYETAIKAFGRCRGEEERIRVAKALEILAGKAGIYGMVGGQCVDVEAEKKGLTISAEQMSFIDENKTAALIEASMMIGAVLAGADADTVEQAEKCASNIGIAFQIRDDILDIEGDEQVLGKPIGSDEKNEKVTYVSYYGMDRAKEKVESLSGEAQDILRSIAGEDSFLIPLTAWLIDREK